MNHGVHGGVEFSSSVEKPELDKNGESGQRSVEMRDQRCGRSSGPTRSQDVVDDKYALACMDGIVMNLEFAAGRNDDYGIYLKMAYAY